jgi:hypothetical protein
MLPKRLRNGKMLETVTIILLLFLVASMASAIAGLPPVTEWEKTFGGVADEWASSVQQTRDGGYIIAGYASGQFYLIKTDGDGKLQWEKVFGDVHDIYPLSVQQTNDGGYIIVGSVDFEGICLVKTDSDGKLQWEKKWKVGRYSYAYSVQQTSDGGYVVAGSFFHLFWDFNCAYLAKTDVDGNLQWNKTFGREDVDNFFYSVQQTSDGGYIAAGDSFEDFYLVKTDANGNLQWEKTFKGVGEVAYSVQQTNDRGYIMAGRTYSDQNYDFYLLKTDTNGKPQWNKTIGGTGEDGAYSVRQAIDGGYIVVGYTESFGASRDAYVIKTDSRGNLQWQQTYGGSAEDEARSAQQTRDGDYIIAGYTRSYGAGGSDVYLIRLDASKKLSVKLSGEFDYLLNEPVKIRLAALVRDADSMDPVSGAKVTIQFYDEKGLNYSSVMKEKIVGSGIYEWTSSGTIKELGLKKGVYLVRAQASFEGGPTAEDMLLFHIDPPAEANYEMPLYIALTALSSAGITALILRRREIIRKIRT